SKGEPKGIQIVPQSCKGFYEYFIPQENEQGQTVFQLAGRPNPVEESLTDIVALEEGYITITALASDMTDHDRTELLKQILW
ncbi:MAG: hypothetical protein ACYSTX_03910, partial [Planctomycetota bacterium]